MTEPADTAEPTDAAARAAQLRDRRTRGNKPAAAARILSAGLSATTLLGLMAVMGATADTGDPAPAEVVPPPPPRAGTDVRPVPTAQDITAAAVPVATPVAVDQPAAPVTPIAVTRQSG